MKSNPKAIEALLTLVGQNTFSYDALVNLLVEKGIITLYELDEAMERIYLEERKEIDPAEWARRCIDPEQNKALDDFFDEK